MADQGMNIVAANQERQQHLTDNFNNVIPSEYITDVGQSLPEIAEDLVRAHASQRAQLQHRQETLHRIQESIEKESLRQTELQHDIHKTNKRICLSQEEGASLLVNCGEMEKNMNSLITENQKLQHVLSEIETERVSLNSQYKHYCNCMSLHVRLSENVEHKTSAQRELRSHCKRIDVLRNTRATCIGEETLPILSGDKCRRLAEEIETTRQIKTQVQEDNKQLRDETVSLNQYIKQLHSSLAVGRKRRQAQLTRLHHQLQEAQGRRHQWAEEADRLRAAIRKLRQKIEE